MKKIKLLIIAVLTVCLMPLNLNAASKEKINVYIFKGEGCGYCAAALQFFSSIEDEYGKYFELKEYEVWNDTNNATLMTNVAAQFGEEVGGVPYIIIGDKTFQGYAESYDDQIISAITTAYNNDNYEDIVAAVAAGTASTLTTDSKSNKKESKSDTTTIIIIAVALIGFVALFYFARDPRAEEEIVEVKEEKKETVKKVEEKKVEPKKTTTKKTTTATKTTAKKPATKTAAKKTTTKKTTKK